MSEQGLPSKYTLTFSITELVTISLAIDDEIDHAENCLSEAQNNASLVSYWQARLNTLNAIASKIETAVGP